MKKIAISTWCTDDYAEYLRPDKLKKLVNHFHPEIDFHVSESSFDLIVPLLCPLETFEDLERLAYARTPGN